MGKGFETLSSYFIISINSHESGIHFFHAVAYIIDMLRCVFPKCTHQVHGDSYFSSVNGIGNTFFDAFICLCFVIPNFGRLILQIVRLEHYILVCKDSFPVMLGLTKLYNSTS